MTTQCENPWRRAPNAISIGRLALVPLLLAAAHVGSRGAFAALFGLALFSDWLDGWIARRHRLESPLGAQLDTWADFAMYMSLPAAVWWLWPDLMRREAVTVGVAVATYLLPAAAGYLKFRRMPSYHTWCAKLNGGVMAVALPVTLLGGPAWLLRAAVALLVAGCLEEIAITAALPRWTADVRSLRRALRLRRESRDQVSGVRLQGR